jgi:hypothetical protein
VPNIGENREGWKLYIATGGVVVGIYPNQLTPKTASVLPPEEGHLTPETCRGLRQNKQIMNVKAY